MGKTRYLTILGLLALVLAALFALPAYAGPQLQTSTPVQTSGDWANVQQAGTLVVGTAADYEPFEFYSSNYELDGFDIALMRELGKRMGIEIVFKDFAFDGLLDALRLEQVDAAIAAISVTPDRREIVDFTNLYYIGEDAALARSTYQGAVRSATDLAGKTIGVQRGTTYQAWVQQNLVDAGLIVQKDLVAFEDTSSLVRDLRNGKVDVALMGKLPAQQIGRRFTDLKVVGESFNRQQYAIATRQGSTLVDALNEALLQTQKDGTFSELAALYLGVQASVPPAGGEEPTQPAPTPTPAATPTPAPCIHGMAYVADLNYDDKNMKAPPVMAPGQQFTKRWRVRNSGTCAWEPGFQLAFVGGNRTGADMGGTAAGVDRQVEPGQTFDFAVALQAPREYGTFQGFWKMQDDNGRAFGEVIWVGIQVPNPNPPPPPPPPPAGINPNLRADANFVNAGQCTTIRWDVDNVNAVFFIDGGNQQGVGGHDARSVCPTATTTYTLRVIDRNNRPNDFTITINVQGGGPPPPSINFWVDNATINAGQCTTVRWDVQNVREVYLDNRGVAGQGSQQVCPGGTTTYTLRVVRQDGGQETRQVTVTVVNQQPGPTINSFTVNTNQIRLGQCVTLRWSTSNANTINLARGGTILLSSWNPNAALDDCPAQPGLHEYKLDAFGNGQTAQRLTVDVQGPQPR